MLDLMGLDYKKAICSVGAGMIVYHGLPVTGMVDRQTAMYAGAAAAVYYHMRM